METFQLFLLASICKKPIQAAACAIVLAQRQSNDKILDNDKKHSLEKMAGKGCLDTLKNWKVDPEKLMSGAHCVWNK